MLVVSSLFLLLLLPTLSEVSFSQNTPKLSRDDFPPGFVLGAGTSAYQAEGAVAEDGRTPSIWDTFTHAGRMEDKSNADVSADHYHKYKEDVKLMSDINLDAYRFSISWSRLLPNGRGAVNPKGVQYYNNIINELISHGIQPHVTIYHLDLPQILEDEYGGWLSPKIVEDFTAYADACFREFGDRVAHWTTINEPNINAIAGYDNGLFAPGRCSHPFGINCTAGNSTVEPYIAGHFALLAHASAATLYREKYQAHQKGWIGMNVYATMCIPFTNSTADVEATQRALDFYNGWFIRPVVFGDYPKVMKKIVGSRIPSFTKSESERLKGSIDFLGINHYITEYIQDDSNGPKSNNLRDYYADMLVKFRLSKDDTPSGQILPFNVPFNPSGLQGMLEYFKTDYGNPPIYIQENGFGRPYNETFNDTARIEYVTGFLNAIASSIRNGSNTKGYFLWSFLDVFELLNGYTKRYGLYHVDFEDKARTRRPKHSAHWYADLLKESKPLDFTIKDWRQISLLNLPAVPSGLQAMLEYYKTDYGNPPIYIQENGFGGPSNETLNDTARIEYVTGYLNAVTSVIRNRSNTKGYFLWSFLDVFELLGGYTKRYGLYHVDFEDKARTRRPKLSAHWYADLLKESKVMDIEKPSQQAMAHHGFPVQLA